MPVFIQQESGASEFPFLFALVFFFFFFFLYYLFIQVKSLRGRATVQFKNRLVSRCSSNPSTHHEFLFIIRSCLAHKKDETATRACMHVFLFRAILLQVLMQICTS